MFTSCLLLSIPSQECAFPCACRRRGIAPLASYAYAGSDRLQLSPSAVTHPQASTVKPTASLECVLHSCCAKSVFCLLFNLSLVLTDFMEIERSLSNGVLKYLLYRYSLIKSMLPKFLFSTN